MTTVLTALIASIQFLCNGLQHRHYLHSFLTVSRQQRVQPFHCSVHLLAKLLGLLAVELVKLLAEFDHLPCEADVLLDELAQRVLEGLAVELHTFEAVEESSDAVLHLLELVLHHHGFKYSTVG